MEESQSKGGEKNDKLVDIFRVKITKKKTKLFSIITLIIGSISLFVFMGSISSIFYILSYTESIDAYYLLSLIISSIYSVILSTIIYIISFKIGKRLWKK